MSITQLYGEKVIGSAQPNLKIPHPRMTQRAFVLVPLAEVIPDSVVPPEGPTVRKLLEQVEDRAGVVLWGEPPAL